MASFLKFGVGDPEQINGSVFGTFNVQYKPEEFERIREDGFTVMGMVPDCRVFIYGAELTKDVLDVSVNNSLEGNTCDITLTNPRGRYEITKQDLMGKWREDKDILAAYDYSQFNRMAPGLFDNFMDKITETAFGKKGATAIKQGMNIARSANSLMGSGGGIPKVRGVTRQIFETKHYSGITKHNGDVVFDYKDPVYVFFKGRFSPLWYFGFTGIITGWDDSDAYEQTYSIKLKCEDITTLWKRSKLTEQGAMFAFSRGEDRFKGTNTGQSTNPTQLAATFNFSDLIKVAVYSYNYGLKAYNCHESNPGKYTNPDVGAAAVAGASVIGGTSLKSGGSFKSKLKKLQDEAFIDARYMFTRSVGGWGISLNGKSSFSGSNKGASGSSIRIGSLQNAGIIPISEITYIHKKQFNTKKYKLNESPLGPSAPIYFQLNEIEFPEKIAFTGDNLKSMLNVSVRYWEAEHSIASSLSSDASNITGTGWKDNKAFGIAGVHPALTYDFISNFNILDGIWQQCYKSKKEIDKVIMSPNDKIRSTVGGMPTELVRNDELSKAKLDPIGTAFNFFRPRLFIILPRRFSDRNKKAGPGKFQQFENLFKESATSVYEFLKEKTKSVEYLMYASPCGDVFIEPELYDFHPLDFSSKIESKNIIVKEVPVKVRSYSGLTNQPATRQSKAYMFNSYANHPFFIMEKDRMRTTQTFNHQLIHTEVTVRGGTMEGGGILEVIDEQTAEAVTAVASGRMSRGYSMQTAFANGVYVADGFQKNFEPTSAVAQTRTAYEKARIELDKTIFMEMFSIIGSQLVSQTVKSYTNYMVAFPDDPGAALYDLFSEESIRIKKIVKDTLGKAVTALNDNDYLVILGDEFPSLLPSYSKNMDQVLNSEFNRHQTESTKEFKTVSRKSVFMEKLKVNETTYSAVIDMITDGSYNPKDESFALVRDMIRLGTPSVINTVMVKPVADATIKALKEYNIRGGSQILIRNIAEEKRAAQLGIYDPRYDMVKHYGYNPKEPLKNTFIKNGSEAYDYARTVFNRLLGKAFQISMDIIGRPEFMLNRPYYCERKDSIGLLTKYSIRYQVQSAFTSSATLEYVRKNAITFNYSMGDLDPFQSSANNKYFKAQADYYYKLNRFATNFAGRTTDAITGGVAGKNPGFGRALGAKVVGNAASKLMGSLLPAGGVFSMHDRIGHIPFDTRFSDSTTTTTALPGSLPGDTNADKSIKGSSMAALYEKTIQISQTLENRKTNEVKRDQYKTEGKQVQVDILQDIKTIDEKNKTLSTLPVNQERITLIKEIRALEISITKKQSNYKAKETEYKLALTAIDEANKLLYGVPLDKRTDISNIVLATYKAVRPGGRITADSALYSNGLFYQLFEIYMARSVQLVPDQWYIDENSKHTVKFEGLAENITFYILRKQAPPAVAKSGSRGRTTAIA